MFHNNRWEKYLYRRLWLRSYVFLKNPLSHIQHSLHRSTALGLFKKFHGSNSTTMHHLSAQILSIKETGENQTSVQQIRIKLR